MTNKYSAENLSKVHGGRYDYSLYEYKGSEVRATFICPDHGEFTQIPYSHAKGRGCSKCAARDRARRSSLEEFVESARKVHDSRYDYSRTEYVNARTPVCIVCLDHGEFFQSPDAHLRGQGCPRCGRIRGGKSRRLSTEEFIYKARNSLDIEYDYSKVRYTTATDKVIIVCPEGHEFEQQPNNHLTGYGCPVCRISPLHKFLHDELGGENNRRDLLGNGQEVDLWFPEEGVGFEINGVYWHSSKHQPRMYHQDKSDRARVNGFQLYHIWVDRDTDFDLILSWARAKLGRTTTRLSARKTSIVEVSSQEYREFLDYNHLQGSIDAGVRLGLVHEGTLVAVMGFKRHSDGWHLSRFATKRHTSVRGGFTKLLKNFIRTNSPEKIISYSDEAYSDGGVYLNNGFSPTRRSSGPRLYYTNGIVLRDRWQFQRSRILERNPGMEPAPEKELALQEGFYQLYGCKTVRWELSTAL